MWQCVQIDVRVGKENQQNYQYQAIYMIWNKLVPHFRFRCQATRKNFLDRLICIVINETGNNVQFDEFSAKQTVNILNKKNSSCFKDVQIYIKDGLMKILLKQKMFVKKAINKQDSQKTLMTDQFFKLRIQKIKKFLHAITPDLQKCSKLLGKSGLTGLKKNSLSKSDDKLSKKMQIKLFNDIKNVLKLQNKQIQNVLQKFKKDKNQHQYDNFNQYHNKAQNIGRLQENTKLKKYFFNQQYKTGALDATGQGKNETNFYEIQKIVFDGKVLKKHTGGACEIQKIKAQLFDYNEDGRIVKTRGKLLAIKKPKVIADNPTKNQEYILRFQRQIKTIKYLNSRKHNNQGGKKQYLLQYYQDKNNQNMLYLDYLQLNLNQFLYYYRQLLTTKQIFSICRQILQIIIDLHENGVIHRDLKPSNFLVDINDKISLKLIDFSDSWTYDQKQDAKLCGTLPYSPLQSSRNSKNHAQIGMNKPQIDFWSVGILLHQIFYGTLPLSYTPCLAKDIHSLWISQFLYVVRCQKRRGLKIIDSGFQLLTLLLVRVNPQQRLILAKAYFIIVFLQKYSNQILIELFED